MNNKPNTIILLRGLSRELRHWGSFPERLQHHFSEASVICVDLAGNGQHNELKSPDTIEENLEFIRRQLSGVLATGPLHLIALSLGSMVAMQWMSRYPQEIAAAALLSSSFKGVSPFYQRLRPENYINLLKAIFSTDIYQREKTILQMTSSLHQSDTQLIKDWVSYARQNPVSRRNVIRQLLAASRYRLPAVKPDVPILLLNGQQDQLVNPQCSADLAKFWGLPILTQPLAGHDLSLDDQLWVYKSICNWFEGL